MSDHGVIPNPWQALRALTDARIALGRAGVSVPTDAQLAFQLAHARARDAVHQPLDADALAAQLGQAGWNTLQVHSACPDRATYLQRPDLGRRLSDASRSQLAPGAYDLALVVVDGLSAPAVATNTAPLLAALREGLAHDGWTTAPVVIAQQGRVALGDEVGALLGVQAVVVLIGERPGLSSPDSMGIYLTWAPQTGLADAARNCISNVRPAGLGYAQAAARLRYLLAEARRRGLSGIALKDETDAPARLGTPARSFLLE